MIKTNLASSFIFLDALRAALALGSAGALDGLEVGNLASCSWEMERKLMNKETIQLVHIKKRTTLSAVILRL